MPVWTALIGWRGYAAAAIVGALLIAAGVVAWSANGAAKFAAGRAMERLEAAANARQIDAQYRRQEQEMVAYYASRLEEAHEATRISNSERDLAVDTADGLRGAIAIQRARASQAAARAGLSQQAATRAWDVLKTCTDEYAALARDADAAIDDLRPITAWANAVATDRQHAWTR
ncbi:hypothetical protein [Achromobacter anxifer]|uniref:hypothetical protein n=1 Tax=Achromobacter anxifer TaxID=1287737 RepID=UPI002157C055|nr:hypothetical protein [Achromobacter anxifer]